MKRFVFLLLLLVSGGISAQEARFSIKTSLLPEFVPNLAFGYRILNLGAEVYIGENYSVEIFGGTTQKVVPYAHGFYDPLPDGGVFQLDAAHGATVSAAGHYFFRDAAWQNSDLRSYVGIGAAYLHMDGEAHKKFFNSFGTGDYHRGPIANEISKADFLYGIEIFPYQTLFFMQLETGVSVGKFNYYVNGARAWQQNFQPIFRIKVGGFG